MRPAFDDDDDVKHEYILCSWSTDETGIKLKIEASPITDVLIGKASND